MLESIHFSAAAPSHIATSKKSSRNTLAAGSPPSQGRKDPNSEDPVLFSPWCSPQSKVLVPTFLFTIHLPMSLDCKFKAAGPGPPPSSLSPWHPARCLHRVSAQQTRAERMNGRSEQQSAPPSLPEFSLPRSPAFTLLTATLPMTTAFLGSRPQGHRAARTHPLCVHASGTR